MNAAPPADTDLAEALLPAAIAAGGPSSTSAPAARRAAQGRLLAGDRGRPCRRGDHPRRARDGRAGHPGGRRGGGRGRRAARGRPRVLPGRPARRHQGIRQGRRRLHRQYRARPRPCAGGGHRPRPGDRHALCRRRRRGRLDGADEDGAGRPHGRSRSGHAAGEPRSTWSPRSRTGRPRPTTTSPATRSATWSRPARR